MANNNKVDATKDVNKRKDGFELMNTTRQMLMSTGRPFSVDTLSDATGGVLTVKWFPLEKAVTEAARDVDDNKKATTK